MNLEVLSILGFFSLAFAVMIWFFSKKISQLENKKADQTLLEWLKSMQHSMDTTQTSMLKTLQDNSRLLNERLEKAAETMNIVGKEVGQMNEIGRNMRELQEFLKSPKLRGNIGEQVLKDLITQIFPKNSFNLQYMFKSGEKVDAAIKTDAGILPIDAKFPMENFQRLMKAQTDVERDSYRKEFGRDIKKHIDAIAKKYVLPDEGTMDFALMYVPSESVFYEIVNMDDMIEYARKNRIYVVSPSTLYAHLQTILLSFEGKKIESRTREVMRLLHALKIDYEKVTDSLDILGKHLTNASGQYHNVVKGFSTFGEKLGTAKELEDKNNEELLAE